MSENKPKEKFDSIKYNMQYNKENYDQLRINVPKGFKDVFKAYCIQHNVRMNRVVNDFIQRLVYSENDEELKRLYPWLDKKD